MSAPKCRSGVCGKLLGAFVASPVRYAVCQANTARLRASSVRRFTAEEAAFDYRRSAFLDTEAVVLGRVVKGTIVLVEAGTVPQDCVQKCRDALLAVGANLLGAVLTDYDPKKI